MTNFIVVTGGVGHLGKVLLSRLLQDGYGVIAVDQYPENRVQEDHSGAFGRNSLLRYMQCNLESEASRTALLKNLQASNLPIVGLVNAAAIVGTDLLEPQAILFQDQTVSSWRRIIETNLTAAFHLAQGLVDQLSAHTDAFIINISSTHGLRGPNLDLYRDTNMFNSVAYSVSKAGLIHLTKWLATTLAPAIRVNCVSPGGISRNQPEPFVRRYSNLTPLGRMANENEVASAVCFLASPQASYITGQNLVVDGGYTIS